MITELGECIDGRAGDGSSLIPPYGTKRPSLVLFDCFPDQKSSVVSSIRFLISSRPIERRSVHETVEE